MRDSSMQERDNKLLIEAYYSLFYYAYNHR